MGRPRLRRLGNVEKDLREMKVKNGDSRQWTEKNNSLSLRREMLSEGRTATE
jgi:hypothetical protein